MTYREFTERFSSYPLFSLRDIVKADKNFHRRRLVEWQHKGYIRKLANSWYCFNEQPVDEGFLFLASNKIYHPSYVSLESALAYYGFIPEGVFSVTAVSTLKTSVFKAELARFSYRHIKESLFFGYRLVPANGTHFKIALPEKAILDYLYFNKQITTAEELAALRLNREVINESISPKRIKSFCNQYHQQRFDNRLKLLFKFIGHA